MMSYEKCALCGSEDIEKHSETHYSCRRCGLGTDGKPANIQEHFKFLKNIVVSTKIFFPNLSNKELTDKVQTTLHKIEHHPLDRKGFCQYCNQHFDDKA